MRIFLKEVAGHPEYKRLLAQAEQNKPILPIWEIDPMTGKDNADDWKKKSAMREGYELCLMLFTPK